MKKKILMIAPECAPFSKVGGLGDMLSSLSKEIANRNYEVRIITPYYKDLNNKADLKKQKDSLSVHLAYEEFCSVWTTKLGKAKVFFIEFDRFFDRPGIYNYGDIVYNDNAERFTFLTKAALDMCLADSWIPDVIHAHDWTTGLAPVYLNTTLKSTPLGKSASVFTIHNLQHQGLFSKDSLYYSGLPVDEVFKADNCEALGALNMMKAGIYNCTKITTVSPTYAKEIQTSEYGYGLDSVLRFRSGDLIGIVNGIDTNEWNPLKDKFIPANYSVSDIKGKGICKATLQEQMGLKVDKKVPLFGVISRLYDQKGLDVLAQIIPYLISNMNLQFAILGSGDKALEARFNYLASKYPSQVGVYIGYNNKLSHMIEAGSDFFLMPSRFEPCGLNQIYSMAYGTLPIVRATGGLVDTVNQYQEGLGKGDGFLFDNLGADSLYNTIAWANSTWYDRFDDIVKMRQNAMTKDFSWGYSADKYEQVYSWAIETRLY